MPEPVIYVLHFGRPYHHARHDVGIALDGDVRRRMREHLRGQGSPLVRAVAAAGIDIHLVLEVFGDRRLERRFHNRHGTRICPLCRHQPRPWPRQLPLFRRTRREGRRPALPTPLWRLSHAA